MVRPDMAASLVSCLVAGGAGDVRPAWAGEPIAEGLAAGCFQRLFHTHSMTE